MPKGTPLAGDRAAWDADNHPALHANDADTADGIHHTLGAGANQAAAGNHTHAHFTDTSNPHSTTKAQVGLGNVANILCNLAATTAPTANDDSADGYTVGSSWFDVTNDEIYLCLDATEGAAVWQKIGNMQKSVYDTNNDGIVNEAAAVDGVETAGNSKYYGTSSSGEAGFFSLPEGGTGGGATDVLMTQVFG